MTDELKCFRCGKLLIMDSEYLGNLAKKSEKVDRIRCPDYCVEYILRTKGVFEEDLDDD